MSHDKQAFDPDAILASLPRRPGVYRMLNVDGEVIYVGKARSLKNRVSSYFQKGAQDPKTRVMVSHIRDIQVTVTSNENEALLLENNLIKQLKPRYNVYFRDDKSYPYIYLSSHQEFPRLGFYRGATRGPGRYFGPYPSAGAVRETLNLLQKLFPVRQCRDSFFRNRSRPCLQHQIKRCTAPCVGLVSPQQYAEDVRHAVMFLEGRNSQVIDELAARMDEAASSLEYEQAARYRDQIGSLRRIQEKQHVEQQDGDIDVIAAATDQGLGCVQVFTIRGGRNLGNKTFFPRNADQVMQSALLEAFLPQYYLGAEAGTRHEIPAEIILGAEIADHEVVAQVLSDRAGRGVRLGWRVRGERARWVEMASANARHALSARLNDRSTVSRRLEALQDSLGLDEVPARLECFDISHTMGEATVASCVVFDSSGPLKSDYRRFNINDITPGDDYAAMRQALERRYRRLREGEGMLPDVLFIDGGKGQLAQAEEVLEELQVPGITLVGVAKGPGRKPGMETLFVARAQGADGDGSLLAPAAEFILPADSPG
ncbi:MAG: excinuclease ABC subunit UvrC, partial [Pseudomonadota bacterium]